MGCFFFSIDEVPIQWCCIPCPSWLRLWIWRLWEYIFSLIFFWKDISVVFNDNWGIFVYIKRTRCGVEEVGSILNSCLVRSVCWEARSRRGENVERSRMAISLFSKLKFFFGFWRVVPNSGIKKSQIFFPTKHVLGIFFQTFGSLAAWLNNRPPRRWTVQMCQVLDAKDEDLKAVKVRIKTTFMEAWNEKGGHFLTSSLF